MEVYKHSGHVPPAGIILTPAVGVLTAVVLGVAYTYLIVYIPFVYVNFLLTIGLGMAIGFVVGLMAKATKIRNSAVTAFLGLACGAVGLYAAWSVDLLARAGADVGGILLTPGQFSDYVAFLYENGSWGFGDTNVKGAFLVIIWLIETAIVLGGSTLLAFAVTSGSAFCETCQKWIETEEGVKKLSLDGAEGLLQGIATGNFVALAAHPAADDDDAAYVRLDLSCCPTCGESNYLTVAVVKHTLDKKGNESTSKEDFATHLVLRPEHVEQVRAATSEAPPPAAPENPFPQPQDPEA